MSKLNEYDKVQLQGVYMDALIEKMWAERSEAHRIATNYKKKKHELRKN